MNRITRAVRPVKCSIPLTGSASRCPVTKAQTCQASGQSPATQSTGLMTRRMSWASVTRELGSEVDAQIHPGIQRRDLVPVAVEHQSRLLEQLAERAPAGLTPAGMVDLGVHVGVEAVLIGCRDVPGVPGLLLDEAELDDRLAALEAVLPRHREPHRRAVLIGQRLPVYSH